RSTAGVGHRPDEVAALQPLGKHAHALAIVPKQLDQSTATSTEREHSPVEWALVQYLLRQHGEAVYALAHVSPPARQPHAHARWRADHPRSTASTRRRACSSTCASTRTERPFGKT